MRRETAYLLVAASFVSAPVFAGTFTATREDPLVCKRDRDMTLGSHFRAPRTCMLRSQWRELAERTQHELQQIMDGQAANGPAGNGVQGLTRDPF